MRRRFPLLALAAGPLLACGPPPPQGPVPDLSNPQTRQSLVAGLEEAPPGPQEIFTSDTPLRFALEADFERLDDDRRQESEEGPGTILIRGRDGSPTEIEIEIRTRGNFRLKRSTCSFPPLRLDLPASDTLGTVLDGQDKLKLVTHCRDREDYRQNVLEEYLAYRIYNQLTDHSFRVQLAEITYVDTSGEREPFTRMGFLLEDDDYLAERTGGIILEGRGGGANDFVGEAVGTLYVFEYLIGNVDWSTATPHNVEILRVDRDHYPVPYDFDWSGLVNAPYAGPNDLTVHLHDSVRERVYWGACADHIDYGAIFLRFQERREAILSLPDSIPGFSERGAREAREYLEEFYRILDDPRKSTREIVDRCRQTRSP